VTVVDVDTGEVIDVRAMTAALEAHEVVIDKHFKSFTVVGQALLDIGQRRLYQMEYATFDIYLEHRWGLSRSRAYQLMEAATVTEAMSTIVDTPLPANEAQARELVSLKAEPEKAAEVMRAVAASNGGKTPAAAIKVEVETRFKETTTRHRPQPKAPVETVEAREAREHSEAVARDASRIEAVISGWPSLRGIAENPELGDEVRALLTEPDRREADRIIAIYLRGRS